LTARLERDDFIPPNSVALGFCLEVQQAGLLGTLNEQLWDAASGS
jgi:hypothetical protein